MNSPDPARPPPARRARRERISGATFIALALLLACPVYAISRLAGWIDWWLLIGAPLAMSAFTFFSYRSDKRRAEAGEWRIPESTLHLTELLGGWPGGLLAQKRFRHKTSKLSYQISFWATVGLHEWLACDSLVDWRFSRAAWALVRTQFA